MKDEPTAAEKELATQAAQLQTQTAAKARGGFWEAIGQIIPARLLIAAVIVFGGFELFKYWLLLQQSEAQARIKDADAAITGIESETLNRTDDNGDTLALAKAKADYAKAQAEADRAKIEADALNAKVGDSSMRLTQLKAELAAKSAKAAKTRLEATAALDRSGLRTLEERAARAKLEITELDAAQKRWNASLMSGGLIAATSPNTEAGMSAVAQNYRAYCNNNPFARDIGCPPQFINVEPPKIQTALEAALERAGGSDAPTAPATYRENAPRAGGKIAVVNTLNLSLRPCPKPTSECPAIFPMPQGTRLRVLSDADQNGWLKVEVGLQGGGTQTGYVNGKYLARADAGNQ